LYELSRKLFFLVQTTGRVKVPSGLYDLFQDLILLVQTRGIESPDAWLYEFFGDLICSYKHVENFLNNLIASVS
jgi:hypothetical protein